MKFQELPTEVQVIAAQTLKEKLLLSHSGLIKEPVKELASEIKEAFETLYDEKCAQGAEQNAGAETCIVNESIKNFNLNDQQRHFVIGVTTIHQCNRERKD